jgi:plasmid maintenance system antidote protein VapI
MYIEPGSIPADTAIRLGRYFRVDPRFWLNLQAAPDLSRAESENDYSRVRSRTATALRSPIASD